MIAFLTRFRIGPRLAASFLLLLLAVAGISLYALNALGQLADEFAQIEHERLPKVQRLVQMADNGNLIARQVRNIVIFDDAGKQAGWIASIAKARADNEQLMALVDPQIHSAEGRALVAKARQLGQRYSADLDRFNGFVREGEVFKATELLEQSLRDSQLAYAKALDEIKSREMARIDEVAENAGTLYRRSRLLMLGAVASLIALGLALAWGITRSIVAPLRKAVSNARQIAAGDLSQPLRPRGRDEAAELLHALLQMQQSLRGIVGEVRQGVESVASASQQIAQGNQDLSARTEEQASSLQQTAASVEQISGSVSSSARHADAARELAQAASNAARQGGSLVEQAVGQIGRMEQMSGRIGSIVGVIDGIAFQTNLLALNAAVEAARAGESGRGFAVVAAEVRNLSQRSADAAREIKALVGQSNEQVHDSSRSVRAAGEAMGEVVTQAQRVSALIQDLSAGSQSQSAAVEQVNQAMNVLDQMTQSNAALVEQSNAAAESLHQQAQRLAQAVAVFKLAAAPGA
ncbi:MAG: methyl-accepting chemotaxis protein [Burkholderiaceae bacterium]